MTRHITYRRYSTDDLLPNQVDDNFLALDTDLATVEAKVEDLQTNQGGAVTDLQTQLASEIAARIAGDNDLLDAINQIKAIVGTNGLPDITGKVGVLQTDGHSIYWDLIPQSMIRAAFAITQFSSNFSTVELGQAVSGIQFTLRYSDTVNGASITEGSHSATLIPPYTGCAWSQQYQLTSPGSVSFTVHASAYDNSVHTASTQISWLARKFYGVLPLQTDMANLIGLLQNSSLTSSRGGTWTVTAGTQDYIYFAIPAMYDSSSIQFSVGGFSGGFAKVASNISYTNSYGVSLAYDIYKSDNLNLGTTTVTVS